MKFTIYLWMFVIFTILALWTDIIPTPGQTKTLLSTVWRLQCCVWHHLFVLLAPPPHLGQSWICDWQNWPTMPMWFRPFMQELTCFPQVIKNTWFQQVGATLHMVKSSVNTINHLFHNHVITGNGHISWSEELHDMLIYGSFSVGLLNPLTLNILEL